MSLELFSVKLGCYGCSSPKTGSESLGLLYQMALIVMTTVNRCITFCRDDSLS